MKAIVQDRYGSPDVLRLAEIDRPTPGDDEVLVRVHAASLHADVWHVVRGVPFVLRVMGAGLRRPKNPVPGIDMAGRVESVGAKVTRFTPGDEVFGETIRGIQWRHGGAFAEYVAAPQSKLELKPPDLTFEQAAAVPTSAMIALQAVRHQGHVRAGQKVLINGAAGGVGIFAVQFAKAAGAEVTGVDGAGKLETIRSIGADRAIDYASEDFTRGGERYDVIVDIPGNRSFSDIRKALTRDGTYVFIGHDAYGQSRKRWFGGIGRFLRLTLYSPFVSQRMNPRIDQGDDEPMVVVRELLEAGRLVPVIDRTFPLSQVADAIRYLESGEVRGKVVITV